jgi:hypothetical protein
VAAFLSQGASMLRGASMRRLTRPLAFVMLRLT